MYHPLPADPPDPACDPPPSPSTPTPVPPGPPQSPRQRYGAILDGLTENNSQRRTHREGPDSISVGQASVAVLADAEAHVRTRQQPGHAKRLGATQHLSALDVDPPSILDPVKSKVRRPLAPARLRLRRATKHILHLGCHGTLVATPCSMGLGCHGTRYVRRQHTMVWAGLGLGTRQHGSRRRGPGTLLHMFHATCNKHVHVCDMCM